MIGIDLLINIRLKLVKCKIRYNKKLNCMNFNILAYLNKILEIN